MIRNQANLDKIGLHSNSLHFNAACAPWSSNASLALMTTDEESKLISQLTKEYGRVHSISTRQLKEELSSFGLDTRYIVNPDF